jgi:hypothetical protein
MNTRRLTKKYKHKSRSKKNRKNRKTRKTRRRVLKGGVPSSRPNGRPSSSSSRPSSGIIVSKTSGGVKHSTGRPISRHDTSRGVFKHKIIDAIHNFNLKDFYNMLISIDINELPYRIEDIKDAYIRKTTLQHITPKGAFLSMNGLKLIKYFENKYKYADCKTKQKIKSIISLLDQCNMAQGVRPSDLSIIEGQVDRRYYACYKGLYEQIYAKLFPNGNPDDLPVSSTGVTISSGLSTVKE